MNAILSSKRNSLKFARHTCCSAALILVLLSSMAWAQGMRKMEPGTKTTRGIELAGFYGWQFGGDFTAYQGEVEIKDAENFGGMIDIPIPSKPGAKFEFYYSRQNTTVTLKEYPSGAKTELFDLALEYYQVGGVYERKVNNMAPFGSFTLGAVRFAPKQDSYKGVGLNDEWRFAFTLGLGLKSYFSERVGLRNDP